MAVEDESAHFEVRLRDRVPVRLGLAVLAVTTAAFAVALVTVARQDQRRFAEQHVSDARQVSALITRDLVTQMLAGGGPDVWAGISRDAELFARVTGASRILVLATSGTVKAGSDRAAIGTRIQMRRNPGCPGCDQTRADAFPSTATVRTASGARSLRVVTRIDALPACQRCHQAGEPVRGYVSMDFDLAPLERGAQEQRASFVTIGVAAGLTLVLVMAFLFRRLVMRSIHALIRSARRLGSGDLAARSEVHGRNELALLGSHFNHMAGRIEDQVSRLATANLESSLLYALVVEASKNLEMSEMARGVVRVLSSSLDPTHVAFFLNTADRRWICATGPSAADGTMASGDGDLAEALGSLDGAVARLLEGVPLDLVAHMLRSRQLQLIRERERVIFALPLVTEGSLVGVLACIANPGNRRIGEELLNNLAAHLALAATNSRNYTGAITDGLTGLRNKRYGLARLEDSVHIARRHGSALAAAMCDIDHFKRVNDTQGHPAGDAVLREVSRRIAACVRRADVTVRYGGEEFLIILTQTSVEALGRIGEKIRQAVSAVPIVLGKGTESMTITVSVGVAAFRVETDTAETLIARADSALYRAKEAGRNRVEVD